MQGLESQVAFLSESFWSVIYFWSVRDLSRSVCWSLVFDCRAKLLCVFFSKEAQLNQILDSFDLSLWGDEIYVNKPLRYGGATPPWHGLWWIVLPAILTICSQSCTGFTRRTGPSTACSCLLLIWLYVLTFVYFYDSAWFHPFPCSQHVFEPSVFAVRCIEGLSTELPWLFLANQFQQTEGIASMSALFAWCWFFKSKLRCENARSYYQ